VFLQDVWWYGLDVVIFYNLQFREGTRFMW